MGDFNVAVVQMDCRLSTWDLNLEKINGLIKQNNDCDLIVFPEMAVTGYSIGKDREAVVQGYQEWIDELETIAASCDTSILVGMPESNEECLFNAVGLFSGHSGLIGTYRKTHLYGHEKELFEPGNEIKFFDLQFGADESTRLGMEICYDLEFPEVSRTLSGLGVKILCVSSANMVPWRDYHRIYAQSRAMENQVFVLYSNRVGRESDTQFCGGSAIIGPNGVVYESGDGSSECVLRASIDLNEVTRMRNSSIPYWMDRRVELYAKP